MSLRLASLGSIGCLSLCTLLACGESEPAPSGGTGGGGSSSGGMPGAGTNPGTSGSTSGGGGSGSAGSPTGGASSGGSAGASAAGTSSGGAPGGGAGGSGGASAGGGGSGSGGSASKTTFFVTSDTSTTGKLGGLTGADMRCQTLATTAGITGHTFKAYLSTSTVDAKTRIGPGPWYNSNGMLLAMNVADLHNAAMVKGSADLFLTEKKEKVNGQWAGSPTPNQHDILTGTNADGTKAVGKMCADWTSDSATDVGVVGHSDGLGPGMATTGTYTSWNSSHEMMDCSNTAPRGGAGRIYCFAAD